jgi:hypothetical protein
MNVPACALPINRSAKPGELIITLTDGAVTRSKLKELSVRRCNPVDDTVQSMMENGYIVGNALFTDCTWAFAQGLAIALFQQYSKYDDYKEDLGRSAKRYLRTELKLS